MEDTDNFYLTLKKMNGFARAIQTEVQVFQPDILLILARGGFGPFWALQALWEVSKEDHHPPVLITNLGREKLLRYEYHRQAIGANYWPVIEPFDFYGPGERGYFLVWLSQQKDWRKELRKQVESVLGAACAPERILVVDDAVYRRYTTLIALGLLMAEFPRAETRMMAGDLPNWRPDLAAPWLAEHTSRLPSPPAREINDCVYNLAPGASDIDPASLEWEPLTASSSSMREYGKFLSVETWLQLPGWVKDQIQTYVRQSAGDEEEPAKIYWNVLLPEELEFRKRWLSADLTLNEVSHELDVPTESAVQLLRNLANDPENLPE